MRKECVSVKRPANGTNKFGLRRLLQMKKKIDEKMKKGEKWSRWPSKENVKKV